MTNVGDCRHLSQGPSNSYFLQAIPPSSFPTKLAIYITNNSIRISNHCFHCWILFVGFITSMAIRKWLLTPHKKRHHPINYRFPMKSFFPHFHILVFSGTWSMTFTILWLGSRTYLHITGARSCFLDDLMYCMAFCSWKCLRVLFPRQKSLKYSESSLQNCNDSCKLNHND